MRRSLFGAALLALLTITLTAPTLAAPPKRVVSPNEYRIAVSLRRAGVIPRYAGPQQIDAAVQTFIANAHPQNRELKMPQVADTLAGKRTALGRFLATRTYDPSAVDTYVSKPLVILVDFAGGAWVDGGGNPHPGGPLYGNIPAPDPMEDDFTFWPGDFSTSHYQDMLFGNSYPIYDASGGLRGTTNNTVASYFLEQSKDTYTVSGDVVGWVSLPKAESYYGANGSAAGDDLTGPVWRVSRDAVAAFATANPGFDWSQYDQENPFGLVDGGFLTPDGYIDHLIIVHAGIDESAGGGAEGSDAIWAHQWWVFDSMTGGPGGNPGYEIAGSSGAGPNGHVWVGPYTIDPEDGAPGVFCHEFGHDLGLPDEYDTSGAGESPSAFWTVMASGSWLGRQWGNDTQPASMNVWDKWSLGFITPKVIGRGTSKTVALKPAQLGDKGKVGIKVNLPPGKHSFDLSGADGAQEWFSTFGNELDTKLTTTARVDIPAGSPQLSLRTWYEIEDGFDHGYVKVSTDKTHWTYLQSAGNTSENGSGSGLWGLTGSDTGNWATPIVYDLTPVAGHQVYLQFEYSTDLYVAGRGWEITDISIDGAPIPTAAFAANGWVRTDGTYFAKAARHYMAEYRTYDGFDAGLRDCYQVNWSRANWVDFFRYNRGLHLLYVDTWYGDNEVGVHPGRGLVMVVDARPIPDSVMVGGKDRYWRTRIQVRDAAFGRFPTPAQWIYLISGGSGWGEQLAVGKSAQPGFNDARTWWYAEKEDAGTKVPKLGVQMKVRSQQPALLKVWIDNIK